MSRLGEYFEIENPKFVSHVYKFGKPAGFYVKEENKESSRTVYDKLMSEKDFIHFTADKGMNREKIQIEHMGENGEPEVKSYTIRYGSSFLESARTYFRTMMLLNDILLISRLSRSQFYRLFQIEVGASDTKRDRQNN